MRAHTDQHNYYQILRNSVPPLSSAMVTKVAIALWWSPDLSWDLLPTPETKSLRLLIFFCDVPTGYSCPANWVVGLEVCTLPWRWEWGWSWRGMTLSASVEVEFEKNG